MTHRELRRVEADGTRVYADYHRYRPVPPEERKYGVRRPADPRAVRWHGTWLLPIEVLPDADRAMPETRSDEDAYDHPFTCSCSVCRRPEAARWRAKKRREL